MQYIKIYSNSNFFAEKKYIFESIFPIILGFECKYEINEEISNEYIFEIGESKIIFKDVFFSQFLNNKISPFFFYSSIFIPQNIRISRLNTNPFLLEDYLPIIFGTTQLVVTDRSVTCGIDIIGSIFFMLTRWEEAAINSTDWLNRFPAESSLAFKNNFLDRPIVNEMIEMLRRMIDSFYPQITFKPKQSFEIIHTHDIDFLSPPINFREFAKDIIRRKNISYFLKRLQYSKKNNPYDLIDYFMDVSEFYKTRSLFHFMTGHNIVGKDGEGYYKKEIFKKNILKVLERGHIIGLHPSLLTYNNEEMFIVEKEKLEKVIRQPVVFSRQHALRFEIPNTFNLLNNNGILQDSTLGYSSQQGYRCGTGNSFPVFDFLNRKELNIWESPLIIMDTTLNVNKKIPIDKSKNIFIDYIEKAKKLNMPITFLFHNNLGDEIDWKGWLELHQLLFPIG